MGVGYEVCFAVYVRKKGMVSSTRDGSVSHREESDLNVTKQVIQKGLLRLGCT